MSYGSGEKLMRRSWRRRCLNVRRELSLYVTKKSAYSAWRDARHGSNIQYQWRIGVKAASICVAA
jgi:hypothetical protein